MLPELSTASPFRVGCRVTVPARTSICVIDMNDFRPGAAGGGNVGFAFGAFTELDITVSPLDEILTCEGDIWHDERTTLIRYVLDQWRDATGTERRYRIAIKQVQSPHTGLASSAALQLGAWASLNHMFGHRYSDAELRQRIASKYREADNGSTHLAFTTGLSSFLGLYGGFAVVRRDLRPSVHFQIPHWAAAMVVPFGVESVSFGDVEREALTTRGPQMDERDRARKLSILSEQLVPAVAAQDLTGIGRAVAGLQTIGSKVAELDIYGDAILAPLAKLRSAFPCVFMSAVGPGIAVVSDTTPGQLRSRLEIAGVDIRWCGMVDTEGMRLIPSAS